MRAIKTHCILCSKLKNSNDFTGTEFIILISTIMSQRNISKSQFWAIKKQYLLLPNYDSVKANSLKLNQFYDQLCSIFIRNFEALRDTQNLSANLKAEEREGKKGKVYQSVVFLNRFAMDFSTIIAQISNYQIACLDRLREENKPEFSAYFQLAKKLKEINSIYDSIDQSKVRLDPIFKKIKLDFVLYKSSKNDPTKFYDQDYVRNSNQRLLGNIDRASSQIKFIQQRKQQTKGKISQFQPIFSRLKCKLVKNKYNVLKKIEQFVQNGKYCLAEVSELLKQCVINHKSLFVSAIRGRLEQSSELKEMLNRPTEISIEHPLDENKRWESAIRSTLDDYWQESEGIGKILQRFEQYFIIIAKTYQQQKGRLREIINKISQFYEDRQSPYDDLLGIFDMNENLQDRLRAISDKINGMVMMLRRHKRTCIKQGEIVLSLLKIKNRQREGFLDAQESMNKKDISDLVNEIAMCSPKEQIISFYDFWITTQKQLLSSIKLAGKLKRRPTMDSMEISHSAEYNKLSVVRKRPLKEQIWLWKQHKEEMDLSLELYEDFFQDIRRFASEMAQKFNKNDVELESYDCVLLPSKKQAKLMLMSQNIGITVTAQDSDLRIPWKDIVSIQITTNFFDKNLVISTLQGKIELGKLRQDLQAIVSSMREVQEKSLMIGQTKVESKREVKLTAEEIKEIGERRGRIMQEVPTTDGFKLIIEETFAGERIDEIYDLIYSDKPFNFYGREEPCFFSYTGKKSGNFNWVAGGYDKAGPEFYTLQEGVSFKNCPLFSTRKISYNHPMKPTSIPFMPKQSRNEDERRIYWVSHEELVYYIKSLTFEVPMADTFEVHLLHRITKAEDGVRIEIFSNIFFVKDTSFKNIIAKNTDPEIDENMIGFMGEIRKLLRLRKEAARGGKIPMELEPPTQSKAPESADGEVNKLKLYNKVLLVFVLLLLLVNLLGLF